MKITAIIPNTGHVRIEVGISMDVVKWKALIEEMVEKEIDAEFVLMLENRLNSKMSDLERMASDDLKVEDVTRADIKGFVIPYVQELMRLSEEVNDDLKVKIRLCDTMGFGISYPGASLPRSIPKLILSLIHKAGVPSDRLEWHGHNDFHKVSINGSTAWMYGCDALNGTLLGIGERTGNPPISGALFEVGGRYRRSM